MREREGVFARARMRGARFAPEYATRSAQKAPAATPDDQRPSGASARPSAAAEAPAIHGHAAMGFGRSEGGSFGALRSRRRSSTNASFGSTRAIACVGHAETHAGPPLRSAHRSHFTATSGKGAFFASLRGAIWMLS